MLGKLAKKIEIERDKLILIKNHITNNFYAYEPNEMMIARLEIALTQKQKIFGADASFYFHELREAELMQKGYTYEKAHQ